MKDCSSAHLVKIDYENDVVPEAGDPVSGGHGDDEGKQVVDESVESLVLKSLPRQVGNRFKSEK